MNGENAMNGWACTICEKVFANDSGAVQYTYRETDHVHLLCMPCSDSFEMFAKSLGHPVENDNEWKQQPEG